MCDSEYTDKTFLFLMFYFDGFCHERVEILHVSFVYISLQAFQNLALLQSTKLNLVKCWALHR